MWFFPFKDCETPFAPQSVYQSGGYIWLKWRDRPAGFSRVTLDCTPLLVAWVSDKSGKYLLNGIHSGRRKKGSLHKSP
jgi:hypothetical protein